MVIKKKAAFVSFYTAPAQLLIAEVPCVDKLLAIKGIGLKGKNT